jgi:hypothetical protein
MSGCGFAIKLYPEWKKLVAKTALNQVQVDEAMKNMSPQWLEDHRFHPELPGVKIHWGEWGPEHISVPGNACGLDLDHSYDRDGVVTLMPHNVDTIEQASLILTAFLWIEQHVHFKSKISQSH